MTLIWPADWTFTHRGVPSPTQEKIITTGWSRAVCRNQLQRRGTHRSISAQVQFHVVVASKYTVLRLLLLFLAGGRLLLRGTLLDRWFFLRGPAPGVSRGAATARRWARARTTSWLRFSPQASWLRASTRVSGPRVSRPVRERVKKRQRRSAPRTHGLLLRRRLGCRLSRRRLLLFGGRWGPAARARAEPREVVAARLVDGLLVALELRRFVLEVELLRVAARDVSGVPRAVHLRGADGVFPPRHRADASSNFQRTAFEAFLTQRCTS